MDKYAIAAFLIGLWIMCSWVIALDNPYQKYKRMQKKRRARETDRWIKKTLPDSYDILDLLKGTDYDGATNDSRKSENRDLSRGDQTHI